MKFYKFKPAQEPTAQILAAIRFRTCRSRVHG